MHQVVAQDDKGTLWVIGTFSTEARATEWWESWYGVGGPWKLLGVAKHVSGRDAEREWQQAGFGIAERSIKARDT